SNLSIAWNISYNSTALLWNYEYTLQGNKDISHFILEVTDPSSLSDFLNPQVKIGAGDWTPVFFEGPAVWGDKQGNSNPGLPADLYGIKFSGGATSVSYSFQTSQDPVWGNFYVKSGRAKVNDTKVWLYSYNNALGSDSGNELDFIPRPDGGNLPVVPEPISSILFVSGGAALAGIHLQKKKKKT
ncbi:MAG: hypothetical protein HY758_07975, partial [Nitrospirae bacterium]|nr:hypothetical protein [Nitrospirota bacterium]